MFQPRLAIPDHYARSMVQSELTKFAKYVQAINPDHQVSIHVDGFVRGSDLTSILPSTDISIHFIDVSHSGTARINGASAAAATIISGFDESPIPYQRHQHLTALYTQSRGVLFEFIKRANQTFVFFKFSQLDMDHVLNAFNFFEDSSQRIIDRQPIAFPEHAELTILDWEARQVQDTITTMTESGALERFFSPESSYAEVINDLQLRIENQYARIIRAQQELAQAMAMQQMLNTNGKATDQLFTRILGNLLKPPLIVDDVLTLDIKSFMFISCSVEDYLRGMTNSRHALTDKHESIPWALRQVAAGKLRIPIVARMTIKKEGPQDIKIDGVKIDANQGYVINRHVSGANCFSSAKAEATQAYRQQDFDRFFAQLIFATSSVNLLDGAVSSTIVGYIHLNLPVQHRRGNQWVSCPLHEAYKEDHREIIQTDTTTNGEADSEDAERTDPW